MTGKQHKFIRWFYLISTIVSYLGLVVLVAAEAYVRWTLNQNFAFLDGFALAALALLALGQTLGLLYLIKSER